MCLPDKKGGGSPGELRDAFSCVRVCERALIAGERVVLAWEVAGSDALGCLASLTVHGGTASPIQSHFWGEMRRKQRGDVLGWEVGRVAVPALRI